MSCNISVPLRLESCFDQYLLPTDVKFDIIGLCETRLSDYIRQLYTKNNYNPYFRNKSTHGGGLAVYLSKTYQGLIMENVSRQFPQIESLFLKVIQPYKFIYGMIYRPPNASIGDLLLCT